MIKIEATSEAEGVAVTVAMEGKGEDLVTETIAIISQLITGFERNKEDSFMILSDIMRGSIQVLNEQEWGEKK